MDDTNDDTDSGDTGTDETAAEPEAPHVPASVLAAAEEGWAVVLMTDDEDDAEAVHRRLITGDLDAHIRDVDEDILEPDELGIQVIVPLEEGAAAILELELALSVKDAQGDPGRVDRVASLGFEVNDLEIAELAATDGPVYELDDLAEDEEELIDFLEILQIERIRFTLDRGANLIVHHNDEAKVDEVIDRVFGPEGGDDSGQPAPPASGVETPGEIPQVDVIVVKGATGSSPDIAGGTAAVSDIDGRPAVDDLTPDHVISESNGPPKWVFGVAVVVVIVLLIVLVL